VNGAPDARRGAPRALVRRGWCAASRVLCGYTREAGSPPPACVPAYRRTGYWAFARMLFTWVVACESSELGSAFAFVSTADITLSSTL
jgi:hypothetical protein